VSILEYGTILSTDKNFVALNLMTMTIKLLLLVFACFGCFITNGQDTLIYEQLQLKDVAKKFKNAQEFKVYKSRDTTIYTIGDTLIIGKPATKTTANMGVPSITASSISMNVYSTILVGKWGTNMLVGPQFLGEGANGTKIVINNIQVRHFKLNKDVFAFVYFTVSALDKKGIIYTVSSIDQSIETGEVINPRRAMTREEAITKLKEAKELFDLELISREKYDSLKQKLSPIIMKNQ
jgi:hypothetical protein